VETGREKGATKRRGAALRLHARLKVGAARATGGGVVYIHTEAHRLGK